MATASSIGPMAGHMKECLSMNKCKGKGRCGMKMEINIVVSFSMEWATGMGCFSGKMVGGVIKGALGMMCRRGGDKRVGRMDRYMWANMRKGSSMDMENINGRTVISTRECGLKIR